MALIHCPECNYELSSKAKNCPNCGYPISSKDVINASVGKQEQRFHDNKKIIIPIVLIIVVFFVFMMQHPKDPFEKYYSYLGQEKQILDNDKNIAKVELTDNMSMYTVLNVKIWGQSGNIGMFSGEDKKINYCSWDTNKSLSDEEEEALIKKMDKLYGKHDRSDKLFIWENFKDKSVHAMEEDDGGFSVIFLLADDE